MVIKTIYERTKFTFVMGKEMITPIEYQRPSDVPW